MEPGKEPLTDPAVKESLQKFIGVITGTESVAVAHHQLLRSDFEECWFPDYGDTQFLREVIKHPHVVVAGEQIHRNAFVAQFGKFAQQADESLWDGMRVLKPEIKYVAEQINCVRIMPDRVKPLDDLSLPLQARLMIRNPQVEVCGEIDLLTVK